MKGHERPLTFLKYNRDGDLLFSCAKDHTPTVWYADNGERLGTYRGHNGAVWCCDVSRNDLPLFSLSLLIIDCRFGLFIRCNFFALLIGAFGLVIFVWVIESNNQAMIL